MSLIVCKFGGTSVASPERIRNVAKRLVARKQEGQWARRPTSWWAWPLPLTPIRPRARWIACFPLASRCR